MTQAIEFTCSLDDGTLKDRLVFFRERLLPHALGKIRNGNSLQIDFAWNADLREQLLTVIALEQRCCGFLDFELTEDLENSRLLLNVTGPVAAQAVLDQIELAFVNNGSPVSYYLPD